MKLTLNGQTLKLAGRAPWALAIIQILAKAPKRAGFTVEDLAEKLPECGLISPSNDVKNSISNLLSRLKEFGVVGNPKGPGKSRRYILCNEPQIRLA